MSSTLCPRCDSLKQNVEFKTCLEGKDTYVCEGCFNDIEDEEEDVCCDCVYHGDDGCKCVCHTDDEEKEEEEEDKPKDGECHECGKDTSGRKIRSLWNNVLCEECGEDSGEDEEED